MPAAALFVDIGVNNIDCRVLVDDAVDNKSSVTVDMARLLHSESVTGPGAAGMHQFEAPR